MHVYVATTTNLAAELRDAFKVQTAQMPDYAMLDVQVAMASQGSLGKPKGVIITTELSLNHSRETALSKAYEIRRLPGLELTRVLIVDARNTVGGINVYVNQNAIAAEDVAQVITLTQQGGIPVLPYSRTVTQQIGQILELEVQVVKGVLIVIFSIKGGVGKTTTACGLASALQFLLPQARVLLVDFDFQDGDIRHAAGLSADVAGLESLAQHSGELDRDIIMSHVSYHEATGVGVIPAPHDVVFMRITPREWLDLLGEFRGPFDFVIADLPPRINALNNELIGAAFQRAGLALGVVTPMKFDKEGGRKMWDLFAQIPEVSGGILPDLEGDEESTIGMKNLMQTHAALVITKYNPRTMRRYFGDEDRVSGEMEQTLGIPVLGVIPHDDAIWQAQERGDMFPRGRSVSWKAMLGIAQKIIDRARGTEASGGRSLWQESRD